MAAIIGGLKDNLDERSREFEQARLTQPLFLNSVPKSGTHLLRNILRMFVAPEQHYHHDFIQFPNLGQHRVAFDPAQPRLSCGHLLFSDQSVIALGDARHILLVRDPYDWVLARARFLISDEFQQPNLAQLKSGRIGAEALMNMAIFGLHQKMPGLLDIYMHNAAAWVGAGVTLVRYEELSKAVAELESRQAGLYFADLLAACGIDPVPGDWRDRVRVGSDRKQSRTARENLTLLTAVELPEALPEAQKRLVDFHAPGLRALLGYA